MRLNDKELKEQADIAYIEGYQSESILDNPYWREYPNNTFILEEVKGRYFVDGWFAKIKEKKNANF